MRSHNELASRDFGPSVLCRLALRGVVLISGACGTYTVDVRGDIKRMNQGDVIALSRR